MNRERLSSIARKTVLPVFALAAVGATLVPSASAQEASQPGQSRAVAINRTAIGNYLLESGLAEQVFDQARKRLLIDSERRLTPEQASQINPDNCGAFVTRSGEYLQQDTPGVSVKLDQDYGIGFRCFRSDGTEWLSVINPTYVVDEADTNDHNQAIGLTPEQVNDLNSFPDSSYRVRSTYRRFGVFTSEPEQ